MADYTQALHLTLDFIGIATLITFLFIGSRLYGILKRHAELDNVRSVWQPVIIAGFIFCSWAILDLISDTFDLPQALTDIFLSLCLIAGAAAFIVALSRLYKLWSMYDRQKKDISQSLNSTTEKSHEA